jgi:hypothetical protein
MAGMGDHIQQIDDAELLGANGPAVVEVDDDLAAPQPPANGPMHWTPVQSGFMLRRLYDLVVKGVKTDKGFKEVHLRQIASMVSEFAGVNVTVNQVQNHMRKWRKHWQKVDKLRDLSGALWDDELKMIVLDEDHLNGHTKVYKAFSLHKPFYCHPMLTCV